MTDREVLGDDVDRKVWRFQPIALVERQKREGEGNEKKNLDGCAILRALTATNAQEKGIQRGDTTEQILIANERALLNAVAKADRAAFLSLTAPEGEWTTSQGFIPLNLLADGLEGFRLSKWEILNPSSDGSRTIPRWLFMPGP
jgi:hypothetical protein